MYTINTFALSRQNNQESSALHGNVIKMLSGADIASLGLTSQYVSQYEAHLIKLTDQVYATAGSAHTQLMKDADARRDKIYSRIHAKLTFAPMAEEGHDLRKIGDLVQSEFLAKYNGRVPQLPYQEETAVLKGFIFDLNDKLTEDDQELLGIAADIMQLEKANNDFQKAYLQRNDERAEADLLDKTASIRTALADDFAQLCIVVQYWANTADTESAAKRDACQAFISRLNILLADALARVRQRRKGITADDDDDVNAPSSGSGTSGNSGGSGASGSGTSGNNGGSGASGSGTSGTNSGSGTAGSGSGTGTSGGKDYNDHDGIAEW